MPNYLIYDNISRCQRVLLCHISRQDIIMFHKVNPAACMTENMSPFQTDPLSFLADLLARLFRLKGEQECLFKHIFSTTLDEELYID